jgi:hypothetical protein
MPHPKPDQPSKSARKPNIRNFAVKARTATGTHRTVPAKAKAVKGKHRTATRNPYLYYPYG